jgi:hypothetical protein
MRRALILLAAGVVVVAGAVFMVSRNDDPDPSLASSSGLASRTVAAGEVDVKIEPLQLSDGGAVFKITLDTHSVELDADLTLATLDVGGSAWPIDEWSGDGPGGHHREGELRFRAAGSAAGTATLTIPELPDPVEASWQLDG